MIYFVVSSFLIPCYFPVRRIGEQIASRISIAVFPTLIAHIKSTGHYPISWYPLVQSTIVTFVMNVILIVSLSLVVSSLNDFCWVCRRFYQKTISLCLLKCFQSLEYYSRNTHGFNYSKLSELASKNDEIDK